MTIRRISISNRKRISNRLLLCVQSMYGGFLPKKVLGWLPVCFLFVSENPIYGLCILYLQNAVFVSIANSMTISSPKKGTIMISLFFYLMRHSVNDYDNDDNDEVS